LHRLYTIGYASSIDAGKRERERKRKSNFDAGKNHATTIIVGTPVAAIEPVLGDAGDDAIASV
jgi:hypothetical protein